MFKKIKWLFESTSIYTLILTGAICGFILLEAYYPLLAKWIPFLKDFEFFPEKSEPFVTGFIEWSGVLYGLLLSLILVRAWEQYDAIGREFDREADSIKILHEDILLFREEGIEFKKKTLESLREYVDHVINNYPLEADNDSPERTKGDGFLRKIREGYNELIHSDFFERREAEILTSELLRQLNTVIDIRGDRISRCNQRLFQSLRFVSLIASIIFAIPFYFVKFHQPYGLLDSFLVFSVIFLVIFILATVEDLDEPFYGSWKLSKKPWFDLQQDIKDSFVLLGISPSSGDEREHVD